MLNRKPYVTVIMDSTLNEKVLLVSKNNDGTRTGCRKSKTLGLRFPYDWSNPEMPEDALIAAVIERELFEDVCLVCLHFGFDRVESIYARLVADKSLSEVTSSIPRMLENIKRGFDATD